MSGLRSSSFASKGKNIWKKVGETRRDRRAHSILILISGEQWLFGRTFEGLKARAYCTKKRHHLRKKALRAVRAPGLRAIKKTLDPEDDDSDRVADARNSSENITAVWWLLLDMNFAKCEDALSFCSFWFERAAR